MGRTAETLTTMMQHPENPKLAATVAAELRTAQPSWAGAGLAQRLQALADWREALLGNRSAIVAALAADTGRTLLSNAEFEGVLRRIAYWMEKAPLLLAQGSAGFSETVPSVRYEHCLAPLGLVGVISPWNFPLLLTLIDALPALAAGCTVLAKPSELTPRFVEPLRQTIQATPQLAAALRFIQGGAATGEALVEQVDAVCFTGSVATGRLVGAQAGRRLIPAFLELGGKDPLIVLAEANLQIAVTVALRGSVLGTGQACQSIERVYVHEALHDAFVARLVEAAGKVSLHLSPADSGHLGPFMDERQAARVEAQLADAEAQGAVRHCGGLLRRTEGTWCSPVVLTKTHHDMLLYREETFGPLIPVMPFADDEQAIELANDSEFGLSAAVLGDEAHALAVARRLRAGAVSINDAGLTAQVSDVEKDSFGVSGVGRSRMGASGLLRFLRKQALLVQTQQPASMDAFRECNDPS